MILSSSFFLKIIIDNPLRRRTAFYDSVEDVQVAAAWEEGDREWQSDKIHCGGGSRVDTRRGPGKIVAYEDLAPLSYLCLCVHYLKSWVLTDGICVPFATQLLGMYFTT